MFRFVIQYLCDIQAFLIDICDLVEWNLRQLRGGIPRGARCASVAAGRVARPSAKRSQGIYDQKRQSERDGRRQEPH